MRIGFDAKRYFHNNTGLGSYSRSLIDGLRQFCPDNDYILYDEKPFARTFRLGCKAEKDGCGIFHGLSNELPLDIGRTGVRSVVTIHDVAWKAFPDMYHRADRIIYDIKYGLSARNADRVVAISHSTKADLTHYYGVAPERISVIYQPVQRHYYTPIPKEEALHMIKENRPQLPREYMLSVGTVNSRKNLLRVLDAMARIPAGARMPLVIVGGGLSGSYARDCRRLIETRLDRNTVTWIAGLDDNRLLQALYTGATALLYPSQYEGFGLPVVEALLQGCPVLTSNVSSLPEAAGPGGLFVSPHDTDEIMEGIMRLADDSALRDRLATEGREYCRTNFAPETLSGQMTELYRNI